MTGLFIKLTVLGLTNCLTSGISSLLTLKWSTTKKFLETVMNFRCLLFSKSGISFQTTNGYT